MKPPSFRTFLECISDSAQRPICEVVKEVLKALGYPQTITDRCICGKDLNGVNRVSHLAACREVRKMYMSLLLAFDYAKTLCGKRTTSQGYMCTMCNERFRTSKECIVHVARTHIHNNGGVNVARLRGR